MYGFSFIHVYISPAFTLYSWPGRMYYYLYLAFGPFVGINYAINVLLLLLIVICLVMLKFIVKHPAYLLHFKEGVFTFSVETAKKVMFSGNISALKKGEFVFFFLSIEIYMWSFFMMFIQKKKNSERVKEKQPCCLAECIDSWSVKCKEGVNISLFFSSKSWTLFLMH